MYPGKTLEPLARGRLDMGLGPVKSERRSGLPPPDPFLSPITVQITEVRTSLRLPLPSETRNKIKRCFSRRFKPSLYF
ncbi:hypothetical protein SLA2020_125590 [Shorea laevis]